VIDLGLVSEITDIDHLKSDVRVNYIYRFNSYFTENTHRVQHKDKSVICVLVNNRRFICDSHVEPQIH
jgi:hypothetical protein